MVFFVIALIIFAVLLQQWHMKHALQGVSYRFSVTLGLTAPDENFELVTTLTNHTRRFIPYIKMTESLPPSIAIHATGQVLDNRHYSNEPHYLSKVYLLPKGKLIRRIPVSLPNRGRHAFRNAWLWGGDFLGLEENCLPLYRDAEVVVYPRPAESDYLHKVMGGFLGDMSIRRFIIEDPVLTVGFREYTGREPLKQISWLQSAKAAQIMVKTHDYTTELSVSVALNVEAGVDGAEKSDAVEECFSIGHAVCRQLENKKIKYDFFGNFSTLGAEYATWKYIPEGLGTRHFHKILEGLGRASHNAFEPFEALLERTLAKQTGAKSLIVITPGPEAQARLLLAGRDEGRAVILSGQVMAGQKA
jgi:uncharacterized protein (DUF58 family)